MLKVAPLRTVGRAPDRRLNAPADARIFLSASGFAFGYTVTSRGLLVGQPSRLPGGRVALHLGGRAVGASCILYLDGWAATPHTPM